MVEESWLAKKLGEYFFRYHMVDYTVSAQISELSTVIWSMWGSVNQVEWTDYYGLNNEDVDHTIFFMVSLT